MASQTAMDIMHACNSSWPTDHSFFESAKAIASAKEPAQAKKLDELMERTEQGMCEKDMLDHRVGQILGLEAMVAHDWPTNRALFLAAIVKLNAAEDYAVNLELQRRWALADEGFKVKTQLDACITEILTTELESQWTEEEYKAHCLPKNAGPYDHLTEEDWNEYEKSHRDSGCEGDQTNGGSGVLLCKGPVVSPITVPQELSIAEDDAWVKDLVRLVAESKAIREAPLSAFADLAALEDDDTIPEVDIEAA